MNAAELIAMSQDEDRTITHYADTTEEFASLVLDLTVEADDSVEESGQGHSGPEARGWIGFFADDWRVDLVRPE